MLKFQNYKHYKLPITINPLEYGKLIYQNINLFIVSFNRTNIALINQNDLYNHVKIFKEGNFKFEYKDHKIDDNSFTRSLDNSKFSYKNNKLISINKNIVQIIFIILIISLNFDIFLENNSNIALSLPLFFKRDLSKNYYSNT
jgi:hypothetical protein